MRHIALISEHAFPLDAPGSFDSGGHNVYVAQLARHLASLSNQVDVYIRRDHPEQPLLTCWLPGIRGISIAAGPAHYMRKEALLPCMEAFGDAMQMIAARNWRYDIVHANFFMSVLAARRMRTVFGNPVRVTPVAASSGTYEPPSNLSRSAARDENPAVVISGGAA